MEISKYFFLFRYVSLFSLIFLFGCSEKMYQTCVKAKYPLEPSLCNSNGVDDAEAKNNIDNTIGEFQKALLKGSLHQNNDATKVSVVFNVVNTSSDVIVVQFTSGLSADLALIDKNDYPIWKWSNGMMATQAIREDELQPGNTSKFEFTVPRDVINQIEVSSYRWKASFLGRSIIDFKKVMPDVYLYAIEF